MLLSDEIKIRCRTPQVGVERWLFSRVCFSFIIFVPLSFWRVFSPSHTLFWRADHKR